VAQIQLLSAGRCPCAGRRNLGSCCGAGGRLRPPWVSFGNLTGPITGHENPHCYARELKDCSLTVTREHYISRALLTRLIPFGDKPLTMEGVKAAAGSAIDLPPAALTAKVLCGRHNGMLSPLDAMIEQFYDALDWAPRPDTFVINNKHRVRSFNGRALEAWFLKVALGLLSSGNASYPGMPSDWRPSTEHLQILFGGATLPAPLGLYATDVPHPKDARVSCRLFGRSGEFAHMECTFVGIGFYISVKDSSVPGAKSVYRPPEFLRLEKRPTPNGHLLVLWDNPGGRERVTLDYRSPPEWAVKHAKEQAEKGGSH